MQCQGYTEKGRPCRNLASANGYCHLHGGMHKRGRVTYNVRLPSPQGGTLPPTPQPPDDGAWISGCLVLSVILLILILLVVYGGGSFSLSTGGRQCDRGQPCGQSCISWDYECHK